MTQWQHFVWLAGQAADGLLVMWPVTAVICAWCAIGVERFLRAGRPAPRAGWLLQVAPVIAPLMILALGTIFVCPDCATRESHHVRDHWATRAVDVVSIVQLAIAIVLVVLARGLRLLSTGLQALFLWCSFWAGFLAGMSITGDWI